MVAKKSRSKRRPSLVKEIIGNQIKICARIVNICGGTAGEKEHTNI